jgi:hypothetical protein
MWTSLAVDKLIWDKEGNMDKPSLLQGLLHFNPWPVYCQCCKTFIFNNDGAENSSNVSHSQMLAA